MAWMIMACIGAVLAGLLFGLRDLAPYLRAQSSGVITRKGVRQVQVRREKDPDAFARLLANRRQGALGGLGVAALGVVGLVILLTPLLAA